MAGVPKDEEIAHWWKIQCSKCQFRADLHNGALTNGTCDYIRLMGHSRGCDMQQCEKFTPGRKIKIIVDIDGLFRRKSRKPQAKHKVHKRPPSVCACGEWLDEQLAEMSIKDAAAGMGVSCDNFSYFRNRPGAVMSAEMAEKAARFFGVTVDTIRREEARCETRGSAASDG